MIRAYKMMLIISLMAFGIWGCSKAQPTAENPQTLARIAKLEQDLKSAIVDQDQIRVRLASTEDKLRLELARTAALERERNELSAKLKDKSSERDQIASQYEGFRKTIRDLVGTADLVMQPNAPRDIPATAVSLPKVPMAPPSGS
jgi:septal ring factor EnvC (AmiA/AmiB activator)